MNSPAPAPVAGPRPAPSGSVPAWTKPAPAQPVRAGTTNYRRQGSRRRLRADLVDVVLTVLLVIPVAVFIAQDGLAMMTTFPGFIKAVGIVAGLVAMAMLLEMLLLAARIPFVDRAIGHDGALLKHRALTVTAVSLLFVHAVALLIAYAASEQVGVFAEFASLWTLDDFVLAVASLGLLCLVGFTSWVVVRQRLPHEAWFVLHLVSYAALAISIPHQFSMSGMFASGPARWYWMGFIAVTAFCLLAFRVLTPAFNNLEHRLFVSSVEPAGPQVVNIYLSGRRLHELDVQAGQFFNFRFLAPGLWWHGHPFSTSSGVFTNAAGLPTMRITVRNLGKGTAELIKVRPGTQVLFAGPYGIFSDRARTTDHLILMGSGVGIAPIRALLDQTTVIPGQGLVVLRASSPAELYLFDEFRTICAKRGLRLVTLVGHRGTHPKTGLSWSSAQYSTLRLRELAPWAADADVFICGPLRWTEDAQAEAIACGVPQTQIHAERFAQ